MFAHCVNFSHPPREINKYHEVCSRSGDNGLKIQGSAALAKELSCMERHLIHQKAVGLSSNQGMCKRQMIDVSLSPSLKKSIKTYLRVRIKNKIKCRGLHFSHSCSKYEVSHLSHFLSFASYIQKPQFVIRN